MLRLCFKRIHMLLLFSVFPGKLSHIPGTGQFDMFLRYVIKVDKRKVLRLYFKDSCVLLMFPGFPITLMQSK